MRNIQEIFDAVIDSRIYGKAKNSFMCNALESAYIADVIASDEFVFAQRQIDEYMNSLDGGENIALLASLANAFPGKYSDDAHDNDDIIKQCMPIYKDWGNRPMKENNA